MKVNFRNFTRVYFAFILIATAFGIVNAQRTLTGTWTTDRTNRDWNWSSKKKTEGENFAESVDKIGLSFKIESSRYRDNYQGATFDYKELQGLTKSQVENSSSKVNFRIIREAGTIELEGVFQNGKGNGTFHFTANQDFVSSMKSRGFDFEKENNRNKDWGIENRLFTAAMLNITTAQADDLLSAGFANLDTGDLFKAKIFKVDSAYLRELKDSGFPNLGMEEAVKGRIFNIDGGYLRELNNAGLGNEPFENVVKMRIFKITPEFIAEVKTEGFTNLDIEDLVKMKIFNINGEFIRQAKADGIPLEVEKLVQKRIGVRRGNR